MVRWNIRSIIITVRQANKAKRREGSNKKPEGNLSPSNSSLKRMTKTGRHLVVLDDPH
jgi:hypothetical protein